MHQESGIGMSYLDYILNIHAQERGWEYFISPLADTVMSLVREFHVNLKMRHEDFKVRIKGLMVSFYIQTINTIYSMPSCVNDEYTTFLHDPMEYNEILNELFHPRVSWKLNDYRALVNLPARYLKSNPQRWFLFVASRMIPSRHMSDVTKDSTILVYYILTRR